MTHRADMLQGIGASAPDSRVGNLARRPDVLAWYAASATLVFALPSYVRHGTPPWMLTPYDEVQSWAWTMAFLVASFAVVLYGVRVRRPVLSVAAVLWISPWLLAAAGLVTRPGVGHSRIVALASLATGAVAAVTPVVLNRSLRWLAGILMAGFVLAVLATDSSTAEASPHTSTVVNSALVPLAVTRERGLVPSTDHGGGALAPYRDGFLLITAAGSWYLAWDDTGERLRADSLVVAVPMDRKGIVLDSAFARKPMMRVTGAVVDTTAEPILYVVHEAWDAANRCLRLQVSRMELRGLPPQPVGPWTSVYVTSPCIKPGSAFDPFESGGRVTLQGREALLLTTGDYGLSATAPDPASQQTSGDYGKTLRISLDGRREAHTIGHRNPQGLAVDLEGNTWVAEQGPRGGDELNLITPGHNYGWPLRTYGTDYQGYKWRGDLPARSHAPFSEPVLSFVPSPAFSSLTAVRGTLFPGWQGDLLVGTRKGDGLLRVQANHGRINYTESIKVGAGVRDVAEGRNGRILIWKDDADLVWLAPSTGPMAGVVAYEQCAHCHLINGSPSARGPGLLGVFGRRVASTDFPYSPAMRQLGGRWTEEALDRFLENPARFVPGTSMAFGGIADSAQRGVLLRFLREVSGGRSLKGMLAGEQ